MPLLVRGRPAGGVARWSGRGLAATLLATTSLALSAAIALAHGATPPAPALPGVLLAWSFDAHVWLPILAAALLYRAAGARVDREHPTNRFPRWRQWSWYAGLAVLVLALQSPIEAYDTTLFSVHMVQHLLLTMVAAPLLALGAPITLLLRVAPGAVRRRYILPVLHSAPLRVISFPVVTWVLFAGVMWASHFSPLYDAALESEALHVLEHAIFLSVGLLFWWPVVGADPSPWRLPHVARIGYLFLGMPQSSFLGLAILSAPGVLYPHYATLQRPWGPTPIQDQQLAGGVMWAGGDLVFLIGLILAVWTWMRADEAEAVRVDARLDRERERARVAGE